MRDNLHADDVARFTLEFYRNAKKAAVYNIGGGKDNSCSILEAVAMVEAESGIPMEYSVVDQPRKGDHLCYFTYLSKIKADYPGLSVTRNLKSLFCEMVPVWQASLAPTK